MTGLFHDLRFAARTLARSPGFTLAAVATLALGIGANTAIFSVVDAVLLRPLPYEHPGRLVRIWEAGEAFNKQNLDWLRAEAETLEDVSAFTGWALTLTGEGEPEMVIGGAVSANHFEFLGAEAALGRTFLPEERNPGRDDVVILGHGFWQRRFGGDPGAIGRRIALGGAGPEVRTIVGVMPPDHRPLQGDWQVWIPLRIDPAGDDYRSSWYLRLLGRLAPEAGIDEARAEIQTVAARLREQYPRRYTQEDVGTAGLIPLRQSVVEDVRTTLLLLLAAVGLVLLVACTNVANLLLARSGDRQRELAVRVALGAGRGRLVRQLLTESVLLGAVGGAAGVLLATWSLRVFRGRIPSDLPRVEGMGIDLRVLGFALIVSLAAAVIFGLVPALRATDRDVRETLAVAGRGADDPRRHRLGRWLVACEVALSVVLVVAAGLTLRSLWRIQSVDPGFDAAGALTLRVSAGSGLDDAGKARLFRRLRRRMEALPEVESVGAIHIEPMSLNNWHFPYVAEDHPVPADTPLPSANYRVVTPGYFETLRIPVVAGRSLEEGDRDDTRTVGLINEAMARSLWPDEDPIDKEIRLFNSGGPPFRVVGVVGDVHQHGLDREPAHEMYLPSMQSPTDSLQFVVRPGSSGRDATDTDPVAILPAVQRAVWSVDPDLAITSPRPMSEILWRSTAQERFVSLLLGAFSGLALVLGCLGVYGVTSYTISRRTREIGIRLALGAQHREVVADVVRRGMVPIGIGIVVGLLSAAAAGRILSALLFRVSAVDPVTYGLVAGLLTTAALVASYLPARRATGIDPVEALRDE